MTEKWKLTREQKDEILKRLAARDSYQEIATSVGCSWANIDYYAKKFADHIKKLRERRDATFINQGLRTREKRIEELESLAQRLRYEISEEAGKERDTKNGGLWVKDVKLSGKQKAVVEVFAEPIVRQFRDTLNDIAKEVGHRVDKVEDVTKDRAVEIRVVRVNSASNRSGDQGTSSGPVEDQE
jgi:hypothetical protein